MAVVDGFVDLGKDYRRANVRHTAGVFGGESVQCHKKKRDQLVYQRSTSYEAS